MIKIKLLLLPLLFFLCFIFASFIFSENTLAAANCSGSAKIYAARYFCSYPAAGKAKCNYKSETYNLGDCTTVREYGNNCTTSGDAKCGACGATTLYRETCKVTINPLNGVQSCDINRYNYGGEPDGSCVAGARFLRTPTVSGCSCKTVSTCKKKVTSCSGRCGDWPQNCKRADKDCGGCSPGYYCTSNTKGVCKKRTTTCTPKTCSSLACGTHDDGCGDTISCGGCAAGSSCKGKNANGRNGKCRVDPKPEDPTYTINVLVFYDKYGSGFKKGSEPAYNLCYPATNTSGNGPGSGQVTVSLNGANGVNRTMYKNCRRDGKNTTSQRGFVLTSKKECNTIRLINPTNQTYTVTGYNYSVSGQGTKVVTSTAGSLRKTKTICGNATVRFGVEKVTNPAPPDTVSGVVFIDENENGIYEPETNNEACLNSATTGKSPRISVGNTNYTFTSRSDCTPFEYDKSGSKLVSITTPTGYSSTGLEYIDEDNPPDADGNYNQGAVGATSVTLNGLAEVNFGIKPIDQTYTISGHIFEDLAANFREKSPTDNDYTDGTNANRTITLTNTDDGTTTTTIQPQSNAGYSFTDVETGTYTVSYSGLPSGYEMNFPLPGTNPPPKYTIEVGPSCNVNNVTYPNKVEDAGCDTNGNISNLNFAISPIGGDPWYQTVGGDLRDDSNLSNIIPSSNYASAAKTTSPTQDPGLVFNASSTFNLGGDIKQNSKSSSKGWLITGKKFKPARGAGIRTRESYSRNVITKGGKTILSLFSGGNNDNPPCTLPKPNCVLPATSTSTFPGGTYTSNAGLTIESSPTTYTFGNNKKYVFLVQGDIRIERNIAISAGSSATFIATRDIIIDGSVDQIGGFFSAGRNFIVEDGNGGVLNVNGSVVANANLTSEGAFINDRTLGAGASGDGFFPSVKFNLSPTLILQAPDLLKVPNYVISEVSPGQISSPVGNAQPTSAPTLTPTPTPTPLPTSTPTPTLTPTPTPTPVLITGYNALSGTVTIDAEATSPLATRIGRGTDDWTFKTSPLAFTGDGYISALDDDGTNLTSSLSTTAPEVKYNVCFGDSGRYWIWVRGSAPDSAGDAVAFGVDGSVPDSANPFMLYIKDVEGISDWEWRGKVYDGSRAYIDIPSAGFHNINLYMRNDGVRVDKIYLTDTSTSPWFAGDSAGGPNASGSTTCADNR